VLYPSAAEAVSSPGVEGGLPSSLFAQPEKAELSDKKMSPIILIEKRVRAASMPMFIPIIVCVCDKRGHCEFLAER
jgi:hypothetical protein